MQTERKCWITAKRYGWGGGFLVLARLAGLGGFRCAVSRWLFPPSARQCLGPYLAYVAVLCALLVGVCWLKGEPPRWRWGNDERS
jgi:hypothetical protein